MVNVSNVRVSVDSALSRLGYNVSGVNAGRLNFTLVVRDRLTTTISLFSSGAASVPMSSSLGGLFRGGGLLDITRWGILHLGWASRLLEIK